MQFLKFTIFPQSRMYIKKVSVQTSEVLVSVLHILLNAYKKVVLRTV